MDFSKLSLAELKALLSDLPKLIAQREKQERAAARKELEALAAERGFSLSDLVGEGGVATQARIPAAAKYRNPKTGETWSGRGRAPKWLEGKNKDDFKI